MNRFSLCCFLLGLAMFASTRQTNAQTSIPVEHREPITVQIVDGLDAHPIAHLHLILVAGYDRTDLDRHLWHEDAMTDEHGTLRLPSTLVNLPWLRLLMPKQSTCRANPRALAFSVERVRNEGLSSPNRCGTVVVSDQPGILTVYGEDGKHGHSKPVNAEVTATIAKDGTENTIIRDSRLKAR